MFVCHWVNTHTREDSECYISPYSDDRTEASENDLNKEEMRHASRRDEEEQAQQSEDEKEGNHGAGRQKDRKKERKGCRTANFRTAKGELPGSEKVSDKGGDDISIEQMEVEESGDDIAIQFVEKWRKVLMT